MEHQNRITQDVYEQEHYRPTPTECYYSSSSGLNHISQLQNKFIVTPHDPFTYSHDSTEHQYQNSTVCTDENEDARTLKKRKNDWPTSFIEKKNKKNFEVSLKNEEQEEVESSRDELNYALVSEQRRYSGHEIDKEIVMCKQNLPQENCSSPAPTSPEPLVDEPQVQHSQQSLEKKLKYAIETHKDEILNIEEKNYLFHIQHAFHCPKLSGGDCFLPICKDPKEIKNLVEEKLAKNYKKDASSENEEQKLVNMIFKINLAHTIACKERETCKMPLCMEFEETFEKLMPEDLKDSQIFQVMSNIQDDHNSTKFCQHGVDFQILCNVKLGSGAFGCVSNCWFVDKEKRSHSMAMKRIQIVGEQKISQVLGESLPLLPKLQCCPNVLVPDIILRSNAEVLMIMEKADISLFDYMKVHGDDGKGLPVDACTFILFQMCKGLNQIHSKGFTHGDFKISNCVLTKGGRVVKIVDLDTVKLEDKVQVSGSKGYVAPEVYAKRTVRKPADVFSLCQCIPVMLFGTETILAKTPAQILDAVSAKDRDLADIYEIGTLDDPTKRFTAKQLVKWLRANVTLKKRCESYKPLPMPNSVLPNETLCYHAIKSYFCALMDDLPTHLQMG